MSSSSLTVEPDHVPVMQPAQRSADVGAGDSEPLPDHIDKAYAVAMQGAVEMGHQKIIWALMEEGRREGECKVTCLQMGIRLLQASYYQVV